MSDERSCFVIMPIRAQGTPEHTQYRALYDTVIRPPLVELGYAVIRADDVTKAGAINADVIQRLAAADLVVADLSGLNPNVFYELGIRHALRRHGTILIVNRSETSVPFDLQAYRVIDFTADLLGYEKLRDTLVRFAKALMDPDEQPVRDSPVHDVLPSLPIDVFALAEGSTEGKLREQISELQTRLKRYADKFGPDQQSARDTASEILARTLELARRGELPGDVFRKAREAARGESAVEFLTLVSQLMDPSAVGSIKVEQWLQLSFDAGNLGLPEIAAALNLRAIEQRPNDSTLKSLYYSRLAHSEDPRQREQARAELRAVLGITVNGSDVRIEKMRRDRLDIVGPMLDAYQRDALHEEALRITTAIFAFVPNSSIVFRNHARALEDIGRSSEALENYQNGMAAPDVDDTTASWFGTFLHLHDRLEASCVVKARACELDPEDATNYVRLADEIGDVISARLTAGGSTNVTDDVFAPTTAAHLIQCALSCRQVSPEDLDTARQVIESLDLDENLLGQLAAARQGIQDSGVSLLDRAERIQYARSIVGKLMATEVVQEQLSRPLSDP